ncbi:mannose-6-phosphate isomerase, class I [Millisia brevis]|uniref:mannose-6-phosphate isomerase, class I n=1 Tax=Millisia brevis TaxID=264148 RepID=UPI000836A365|nr:mannose-6-phosphate isomerase, class I [Millisia brevis]
MDLLEGAVRAYAWGSRTDLADLQGRTTPTEHPEAEIWYGAHPADPAMLVRPESGDPKERSLLAVIDSDPVGCLGASTAGTFHNRLPFLLKLLAAAEPLSLQAHPSALQAAQGFAADNSRGIPLDSPVRNYKDDSHKPELIVAIGEFHALAGFRDPARTLDFLSALAVDEMAPYVDMLGRQPDEHGLRMLFTSWITLPQARLRELLPALLDGCERHVAAGAAVPFAREAATIVELGAAYPGDQGVLAATLLNRVVLQPGEGMFLDAGNLHAYLSGVGVEIMANSDNVLRGGLTPKHVDVPELLRVLDFRPIDASALVPEGPAPAWFDTPASEFRLGAIVFDPAMTAEVGEVGKAGEVGEVGKVGGTGEAGGRVPVGADVALPVGRPQIVLCTAGRGLLRSGDAELEVPRGGAAWLDAGDVVVASAAQTAEPTCLYVAAAG